MKKQYDTIEELQIWDWGVNSKIRQVVPMYHQEKIWDNQIYENKNSLSNFGRNL